MGPQPGDESRRLTRGEPLGPAPRPAAPAPGPVARPFVEGELVHLGAVGHLPWENRAGLIVGVESLGPVYYATVSPEVAVGTQAGGRPFSLSLGVPLRFELLDSRPDRRWESAGRLRRADWDELRDFAQVLRRLRWGAKESHVYLEASQYEATTLGHGALMRRYNPHLSPSARRVSLEFDAFGDYLGLESYLNDVTRPEVLGGLLFLKPLSLIDRRSSVLRSFSVGATAVVDRRAPLRNELDLDDLDDDGRRSSELALEPDSYEPRAQRTLLLGYGLDAEIKLVDERHADWKTYFDASWLQAELPPGPLPEPNARLEERALRRSGGLTWGQLLRLNLGQRPLHALRLRGELRLFDPNYQPGYFDLLYDVQRVSYGLGRGPGGVALADDTKLQQVLGADPGGGRLRGAYFEAAWRVGDVFGLALGCEVDDAPGRDQVFVHLELPRPGGWQLSLSYHRRNLDGLGELFDEALGDDDLLLLSTRYGLGNLLQFSATAWTPFGLDAEGPFQRNLQLDLQLELGWSY